MYACVHIYNMYMYACRFACMCVRIVYVLIHTFIETDLITLQNLQGPKNPKPETLILRQGMTPPAQSRKRTRSHRSAAAR